MVQGMVPGTATSVLSGLDLKELNRQFAAAHPKSILQWCLDTVPEGLVQSTAFSVGGMVILDLLYRDLNPQPPVPVFFIDTLHHFPETLQLVQDAKQCYGLHLQVYRPSGMDSRQVFEARYGEQLWAQDVAQFHQLTKVQPTQQALADLQAQAWLTGRRRDQSETRSHLPVFEWDNQGRLKVNPLAYWDHKQVWHDVVTNQVPYNALYNQGYASIGDEPLTTPIQHHESERAGRWRGLARTECGMHGV